MPTDESQPLLRPAAITRTDSGMFFLNVALLIIQKFNWSDPASLKTRAEAHRPYYQLQVWLEVVEQGFVNTPSGFFQWELLPSFFSLPSFLSLLCILNESGVSGNLTFFSSKNNLYCPIVQAPISNSFSMLTFSSSVRSSQGPIAAR